ncbi:hypothetical protein ACT3UQ_05215 [Glutamicibacter sp. AOP12-B1-11]|uniref:hypothetical protein n=1 Tax=Glutamicibacter sp. AOP12-B1-11 TaxID=3457725 RepID=UPI004034585C
MTTSREAKYLSGADLGETVSYKMHDGESGETVTHTGHLIKADHQLNIIEETSFCDPNPTYSLGSPSFRVELICAGTFITTHLDPEHPVTISGTPTPAGLDLHRSALDQDE